MRHPPQRAHVGMPVECHVLQAGVRELHAHDVGDAVLEPSTTPVWSDVNSSGHGIGVGSTQCFDQFLRKVSNNGPDLEAVHVGWRLNTALRVGKVAPAASVAHCHQADRAVRCLQAPCHAFAVKSPVNTASATRSSAIRVRQVKHLNIREDAARTARG